MLLTQTFAVVCALAAADNAVLLEFTSSSCPACVQAAPVVERLTAEGYPVRQLDVSQHRELAAQYGIDRVPTFLMTDGEREIDRVVGPASYSRLARMFEPTGVAAAGDDTPRSAGAIVRGQSPDNESSSPWGAAAAAQQSSTGAEAAALAATVKLTVDDPRGRSHGTGTIIDVHGEEALVVTCGHIFRDSGGRGQITVQLFLPGASGPAPGQLIAYDADDRDIGLVSFRPGLRVTPVKVGSRDDRFVVSDAVFTVGCDHGATPSVRRSQITAIDKYQGAPNIEASGQPVDGRSGGGLFTADGLLIGVCNAADPQDDEGLYAGLATVHWQLAQIGQQRIYERAPESQPSSTLLAKDDSDDARPLAGLTRPVSTAADYREVRQPQPSAPAADGGAPHAAAATEVICIVRSRDNPRQSETIVLENPSAELLQRLADESQRQGAAPGPGARLSRNFERPLAPPRGEVVRGQSDDRY